MNSPEFLSIPTFLAELGTIATKIGVVIPWFFSHGIKIASILLSAFLINRFLQVLIEKIVKRTVEKRVDELENKKRADTLISIFGGTLNFIIWIAALLMILPEFGVNIAPILAGVGLLGLAVGMGARDIISDFISGIFILLEDQYRIGDEVKITGIEGRVSEITLRRTTIRSEDNVFHSIPNSQIKVVAKKSK